MTYAPGVYVAPRIYVACLSSYNNGNLHGEWIDCDKDQDEIMEEVQAMLKASPSPNAEEWAIHDHEGFGGFPVDEGEDFETVSQLAEMIEKHGMAYPAWVGHIGADIDDEQGFEDAYCGEWDSEEEYAENLFDDCYASEIPESLRCYINYESFSRDTFMGDNYSIDNPEGGVWVFRNC